jgi:hypothetical protein
MKSKVEHTLIEVGGNKIPAKIYREMRRNVRFSIAQKGAIMRMPLMMLPHEQKRQVSTFIDWVKRQIEEREKLQAHFTPKSYQDGHILKVGSKEYNIRVEYTDNKSHSAKLEAGVIRLRLAENDSSLHRSKAIKHLLSRIVAQDMLPGVQRRVAELNHLFFKRPIQCVNLKYNLSNWGSCSSRGNINLSTRLLFAPEDVVDYVIIHELAHLVEMNHSDRFWHLVQNAMPDYKNKEAWLKKNWQHCDF